MKLERQLHEAMIEMYKRAGEETGYWGKRFLQSVRNNGGLATAQRMLKPSQQKAKLQGLYSLVKARRADLSLEVLALKTPYNKLFTRSELAEARRRLRELPKGAMPTSITPDQNFPETNSLPIEEGGVKKILVNVYERDPRARKICLEKLGTSCRVCSMNFEKTYGERGKGFIHVHHLDPLGTRKKRKKIDPIKDLVPVCPNCHAMLHSTDPPLGIEELKKEFVKMNVKP